MWRAWIWFAAGALTVASPVRGQFSVAPAQLGIGGAGVEATEVLRVRNEGQQPLQLRFYLGDFEQSETGDPRLLPLGRHPRSCAGRLTLFPEAAVLAPGEAQEVRLTMAPGEDVCWSVVYAEAEASATGEVRVSQRVAVKTFGLAPGLSAEAEISAVRIVTGAGERQIEVRLENTGEAPLRPAGRLEIRGLGGDVVRTLAIEPFTVLPKQPRVFRLAVPSGLPAGRYLAVPIVDFGADYLVAGQATFEVE